MSDHNDHLPKFMRDFHDQKELFKTIEFVLGPGNVSWVEGHIYVIDRFLKFMAMHGYTLRKTRQGRDLKCAIAERRKVEVEDFLKASKRHGGRT